MKIIVILRKLIRIIVVLIFRVDRWHTSLLDHRDYAQDVILELNKCVDRQSILEIGCGLGDIVGNVNYRRKYFFDISINVLRAAKALQYISCRKSENVYKVFDLLRDVVDSQLKLDAIVIVNFMHGFSSKDLFPKLEKLVKVNLKSDGVLVFDIIESNPAYKHNHSISDLIFIEKFNITVLDRYRFGRKLVIARLR